jgi:hypothetical protein
LRRIYYVKPDGTTTWDLPGEGLEPPFPPAPPPAPPHAHGSMSYSSQPAGGYPASQPHSSAYPGAAAGRQVTCNCCVRHVHAHTVFPPQCPGVVPSDWSDSTNPYYAQPTGQPYVPCGNAILVPVLVDDNPQCAQCGAAMACFFPIAGCCTLCMNNDAPIGSLRRRWAVRAAIVGMISFFFYSTVGYANVSGNYY